MMYLIYNYFLVFAYVTFPNLVTSEKTVIFKQCSK